MLLASHFTSSFSISLSCLTINTVSQFRSHVNLEPYTASHSLSISWTYCYVISVCVCEFYISKRDLQEISGANQISLRIFCPLKLWISVDIGIVKSKQNLKLYLLPWILSRTLNKIVIQAQVKSLLYSFLLLPDLTHILSLGRLSIPHSRNTNKILICNAVVQH